MDVVKYLIFRDFIFPVIVFVGVMLIIGLIILCEVIEEKIKSKKKKVKR